MASNLLIVESPSKAKTLKKYLGRDYEILASYGHVRDLDGPGERAAGATRPGLPGGLQPVAAAVEEDPSWPVGGPRAEPGPASHRRARARDREVQDAGILDDALRRDQGQGRVHRQA